MSLRYIDTLKTSLPILPKPFIPNFKLYIFLLLINNSFYTVRISDTLNNSKSILDWPLMAFSSGVSAI